MKKLSKVSDTYQANNTKFEVSLYIKWEVKDNDEFTATLLGVEMQPVYNVIISPLPELSEVHAQYQNIIHTFRQKCIENEVKRFEVSFLDYIIVNTGNSDGWVLTKDASVPNYEGWECHLGNFTTLYDAMMDAVMQFMVKRPSVFNRSVSLRAMGGQGTVHEFFKLRQQLHNEKLPMPLHLQPSDSVNRLIYFNNKPIRWNYRKEEEQQPTKEQVDEVVKTISDMQQQINKLKSIYHGNK